MPLHPNAKEQILTRMSEDLKYLMIKNGMFLDRLTGFFAFYRANEVLPKRGDVARSLEAWIGDLPLIEFCSDVLADELTLHGEYIQGEDRRPIHQIAGYENPAALAQRLVEAFESLPWRYMLTLELGTNLLPPLPGDATSLPIGENTALTMSNLLLAEEFPLTSADEAITRRVKGRGGLLGALLGEQELTWKGDQAYFQTGVEGFVGLYGGGTPLDRATSRLKAFLGLGLAMGLLSHEAKYDPSPTTAEWVVHRWQNDVWAVQYKISLDDEDTRALRALKLWEKFGSNYPAEHRTPWLQSVLKGVSEALASKNSTTLQLAAQWFWDSYKGTDEVLRYVRRMTTLEILLGEGADTSEASLGEILGNRLAYLIGKTHKERTETLAEFKKVYNIRSRILHRGKHRLVGEERVMMSRLQEFCQKALKEEAKIVAAPES